RREIAAEKLAVVQTGATVVLGESEWAPIARDRGAGSVVVVSQSNLALARAAVEEFLGRSIDGAVGASIQVPGRLERYSGALLVTGSLYLLADLFAGDRSSSLAT